MLFSLRSADRTDRRPRQAFAPLIGLDIIPPGRWWQKQPQSWSRHPLCSPKRHGRDLVAGHFSDLMSSPPLAQATPTDGARRLLPERPEVLMQGSGRVDLIEPGGCTPSSNWPPSPVLLEERPLCCFLLSYCGGYLKSSQFSPIVPTPVITFKSIQGYLLSKIRRSESCQDLMKLLTNECVPICTMA